MVNEFAPRITCALEAGDFETAEPLLANFFTGLEADLAQISNTQERAATLQDAIGWMHRWLSLSRVMRSHLNEQIRMNLSNLFYGMAVETRPTVNFMA